MNKTDVIRNVSEKTGIESNTCRKVIDAFEEHAGDALLEKFKGAKTDHADAMTHISARTGISREDCEKVLTALEDVMKAGVSDKLTSFFKRMFSRS